MNQRKKIGIITMHRVFNYGSALQAFALQNKLQQLGFDAEIIDYLYPNKDHSRHNKSFHSKIISFLLNAIFGFPYNRKRKNFDRFYSDYLRLSKCKYESKSEIQQNAPKYDIYVTGSDQVWNPKFIEDDTTFMFSFVKDNNPRVSYASSFATNNIPEKYKELYSTELKKYDLISVRETSGVEVIQNLIQKDASVTCDPTLLLDKSEWGKLANNTKPYKKDYILVYILSYSFNPYPDVDNFISLIQEELGIDVIYLNGKKSDYLKKNSKVIKDAGPNEFLNLFMHAKFVITTSFHGTIFSLIFNKPFYSVIKHKNGNDSRILSLLKSIGLEERSVEFNNLGKLPPNFNEVKANVKYDISKLINDSVAYLNRIKYLN